MGREPWERLGNSDTCWTPRPQRLVVGWLFGLILGGALPLFFAKTEPLAPLQILEGLENPAGIGEYRTASSPFGGGRSSPDLVRPDAVECALMVSGGMLAHQPQ